MKLLWEVSVCLGWAERCTTDICHFVLYKTRNVCYIITKHRRWRANVFSYNNKTDTTVCASKTCVFHFDGPTRAFWPKTIYSHGAATKARRGRHETRYGDGKSSLFIGAKSSISRFTQHLYKHTYTHAQKLGMVKQDLRRKYSIFNGFTWKIFQKFIFVVWRSTS